MSSAPIQSHSPIHKEGLTFTLVYFHAKRYLLALDTVRENEANAQMLASRNSNKEDARDFKNNLK